MTLDPHSRQNSRETTHDHALNGVRLGEAVSLLPTYKTRWVQSTVGNRIRDMRLEGGGSRLTRDCDRI
jgi:hypothetical protein